MQKQRLPPDLPSKFGDELEFPGGLEIKDPALSLHGSIYCCGFGLTDLAQGTLACYGQISIYIYISIYISHLDKVQIIL